MSLSETVSAAGLAFYAEAALVLFFAAFLVVVFQVTTKRAAADHRLHGALPLDEGHAAHDDEITARETPEAMRNEQ